MFDDYESDVCGFNSNWRTEKTSAEGESQTTEFLTREAGTLTRESRSLQVQTDPEVQQLLTRPLTPPGLAKWLQSIGPMVMAELQTNETSNIFKGYDPYADENDKDVNAKILQTFHVGIPAKDPTNPTTEKIPVSSLSWSSTGNTLVVGSGFLYHDNWCQHDANLSLYMRKGRSDDLKLVGELEQSSCVSCVAFHPTEPALLATGTVSGAISVWNLQYYDGEDCHSQPLLGCNSSSHSSRKVSGTLWMTAEQIAKYLSRSLRINAADQVLVTSGSTVITWLINITASTMVQQNCYELYGSSVGRVGPPPEITCVDFIRFWNSESESSTGNAGKNDREMVNDLFAVGCVTGEIIICRTSTAKPITASSNFDPCIRNLDSHMASVLSIAFSGHCSRILLTLGADQEIRLYDILENEAVRVIYPDYQLSSIQWVPGNEFLVLGATSEGHKNQTAPTLKVFSVVTCEEVPIEGLLVLNTHIPPDVELVRCNITSVCFDKKSMSKIGVGDIQGNVRIWNIPFQNIVIPDEIVTNEINALSNMLHTSSLSKIN